MVNENFYKIYKHIFIMMSYISVCSSLFRLHHSIDRPYTVCVHGTAINDSISQQFSAVAIGNRVEVVTSLNTIGIRDP